MPIVGRLEHRLGIILPSRDRSGRRLSPAKRNALRDLAREWFAGAFPGSTEDPIQIRTRLRGRWGSGPRVTVEEVEEMWAYCNATQFRKLKHSLVCLAEKVALEGNQEAVAILIDSGLGIVAREEP